jgi:hypothetical protein
MAAAAQLLLARPLAAWADGVPVGPAPTEAQSRPTVGSDGRGGAIVSYKTASLLVGAVHVNAAGVPDGGAARESGAKTRSASPGNTRPRGTETFVMAAAAPEDGTHIRGVGDAGEGGRF